MPRTETAPPVTIVGAGNWLVSCDRIGPLVLEMCRDRYPSGVELFDSGSAGLGLLDCLKGQELMIIVDACCHGGPQGHVAIVEMDFSAPLTKGTSVHQIGPLETLVVAKQLYPESIPKRILLIQVETSGLTDLEIERACFKVMDVLDKEIKRWRSHFSN